MIKDPKKCSMCGEVFVEPKELSKHILECAPTGLSIPPGQPRPSCDICGITFSSTLNFKRHMDSHRLDKGQSNAPSEVSDVSESNSESKSSTIQIPPGAPIHSPELMQKLKTQVKNISLFNIINSFFSMIYFRELARRGETLQRCFTNRRPRLQIWLLLSSRVCFRQLLSWAKALRLSWKVVALLLEALLLGAAKLAVCRRLRPSRRTIQPIQTE